MSAHAKLSPSSAHRWLNCPGSIHAEKSYENTDSIHSLEGTKAHEVAEWCLNNHKDTDWPDLPFDIKDDQEMVQYVQEYVDYVRTFYHKRSTVEVEVRLDLSKYVPQSFGTADAIVMDVKAKTLHVIDLKYGKGVMVSAKGNDQLRLYALGAYQKYKDDTEIEYVHCHIVQPRKYNYDCEELTVKELKKYGKSVKPRAKLATQEDAPRAPGEKQCQWCKAKADCPALFDFTNKVVGGEFDNLDEAKLDDEAKRMLLDNEKLISSFISAIREQVTERLLMGEEFPGYKIVEGRSTRQWQDGTEEKMVEAIGEDAYTKKLIGVTAALKLIGKEFVDTNTYKPPGKPTLAHESDKRVAFVSTKELFDKE